MAAALCLFTPGIAQGQAQDNAGASGTGEVDIAVDSFGVGGLCRAGEWTGVRIVTSDRSPTPRQILIQVAIPDVDGDIPTYQRSVASNPGVRQGAWLYFRLPMSFGSGDALRVSVSEAEEGDGGFRAGRLLGQGVIQGRQVLRPYEGLIGVIGGGQVGLDQYTVRPQGQMHLYTPGAHEAVEVSPSIPPEGLSDRWMGLMQFDALVWTGDQPGKLDTDRAAAIKEWVTRGGHLIIVLPPVGQTWIGDESYNPLADILPRVRVNRLEGVGLGPYRALLSDNNPSSPLLPKSAVVHEFTSLPDAAPNEAIAILGNPPDMGNPKACVVVRRLVGTGAVTLVGIDLANKGLQMHGRPQADIFWHRVLGHRGRLYSAQELNDPKGSDIDSGRRDQAIYDRVIVSILNLSTSASQGVLLGFVVFITYWLVAAPVSYALLRKWGVTRHAWVAYAATAGLFTAVAWGGVNLIKPTRVSGAHVTLLDYDASTESARMRTWATLLIPWYGEAAVSIGNPDDPKGQNVIAPWDSSTSGDETASFPDARPYAVESRSPDSLTFPTRSTVKQLQFDWAGGASLGGNGGMIQPYPVPSKITLMPRRQGLDDETPTLTGTLIHQLPGNLTNVRIWIIRFQTPLFASRGGLVPQAEVWQLGAADEWQPFDAKDPDNPKRKLDLAERTRRVKGTPIVDGQGYLTDLQIRSLAGAMSDPGADAPKALEALGFISQFPPPDKTSSQSASAERQFAHGWDLGYWFTQPCVIVVGQLGDANSSARRAPCLAPIYVDGKKAPLQGVTVIRWIYPLAADPPAYQ